MEKLRYTVMTKDGKLRSYVDKRWCYCSDYPEAHQHPKAERQTDSPAEGR